MLIFLLFLLYLATNYADVEVEFLYASWLLKTIQKGLRLVHKNGHSLFSPIFAIGNVLSFIY